MVRLTPDKKKKILAVGKGKSNTSKVVKQMIDNDLQIIVPDQIKEKTDLSEKLLED